MEMMFNFTSLWLELQLRLVVSNRYFDSFYYWMNVMCVVCCVLFVLGSRSVCSNF